MSAKAVIDAVVLRGSSDLQRVGVVLADGHEYRVYAPGGAKGLVRKYKDHLKVHEPSSDTPNAEVEVKGATAIAVLEALDKQLALEGNIWDFGNDDGRYYAACICLNGDVFSVDGWEQFRSGSPKQEWCQKCSKRLITRCKKCEAPIRGKQVMTGGSGTDGYVLPLYCYNCSQPYPWMENRLDTARGLLDNDEKLTAEDREKLFDMLQYVMSDPLSPLSPAKTKLIDMRLAKSAAAATREVVLDYLAKVTAEFIKP